MKDNPHHPHNITIITNNPKKIYNSLFSLKEKLVNFNENIGISLTSKIDSTSTHNANIKGLPHIEKKYSRSKVKQKTNDTQNKAFAGVGMPIKE